MVRSRSLAIAALIVALALGVLAVPTAAANPLLAFVNGIPGTKVDVCIGNQEVRSNLKYGKWFQRSVAPGNRTVRFRRAAPGRCTGRVLGREDLILAADDDLTLVGTRRPDKVVLFDNTPVPVGTTNTVYVRHAADVGNVAINIGAEGFVTPNALPPEFEKGDEDIFGLGASSLVLRFAATRVGRLEPLAGPRQYLTIEGRRHEIILVGNKPRNARFVAFARPTLPV